MPDAKLFARAQDWQTMTKQPSKRALVTGGAVRIGASLCRALAHWGYGIVVHHHKSADQASNLADELEANGHWARTIQADLSNVDQVAALPSKVQNTMGDVTLLVNNAAVFEADRLNNLSRASWSKNIAVNLDAPLFLAKAFVASLAENQSGLIVNMIDQRVLRPTANYLSYNISKTGLWTATQILAQELAPNVRVNAIAPGLVDPAPGFSKERFNRLVARTPMRQPTHLDEIVGALKLIVDSPTMTGQMITIDSGYSLGRDVAP